MEGLLLFPGVAESFGFGYANDTVRQLFGHLEDTTSPPKTVLKINRDKVSAWAQQALSETFARSRRVFTQNSKLI